MTGKVKALYPQAGIGIIQTEDGDDAQFQINDVLTFDRARMKPGMVVSFELEFGAPLRAVAIVARTGKDDSPVERHAKMHDDLRFAGFVYERGFRIYSYEERVPGEETKRFQVVTEVPMLTRSHVSLQEMPILCLHLLQAKLRGQAIPRGSTRFRYALTQNDIDRFAVPRPVPKPRHFRRPFRQAVAQESAQA